MRIQTVTDEYGQVYVPSFIYSPNAGAGFARILFLVDTGASSVTILDGDAERLQIDFGVLKRKQEKAIGIGGYRDIYELSDVTIVLLNEETGKLVPQRLQAVDVFKPEDRIPELPFSLMGTDFLKRFVFTYRMPALEL